MARFPKIEKPCPYRDNLSEIMNGNNCSMCKRDVFDLTDMSDAERKIFLSSCKSEVCVSYNIPIRRSLVTAAAIASTALLVSTGATAQSSDSLYCYSDEIVVYAGGLRKGETAEMIETETVLANLPVVYEDAEIIKATLDEVFGMNEEAAGMAVVTDHETHVLTEEMKLSPDNS